MVFLNKFFLFVIIVGNLLSCKSLTAQVETKSKDIFLEFRDTCVGKVINNKREGIWKCYDYTGQMDEILFCQDTVTGIIKTFRNEILISETSVIKGTYHGITQLYKDGIIHFVEVYQNGIKNYSTEYYPNGLPKEYGAYALDTIIQRVINYNPITIEEQESNVKMLGEVKNGIWLYFSNKGEIIRSELYSRGRLIEKK